MAKTLKSGDAVTWKSHGGTAHGKVVGKLTEPTQIKGHKVAASKANPEFLYGPNTHVAVCAKEAFAVFSNTA